MNKPSDELLRELREAYRAYREVRGEYDRRWKTQEPTIGLWLNLAREEVGKLSIQAIEAGLLDHYEALRKGEV